MTTGLAGSEIPAKAATRADAAARWAREIAGRTALGRIAGLEVRLARDETEIAAAQEVRYRVFYDELGAGVADAAPVDRRDADRFDLVCDHLLVLDTTLPGEDHERIVGTYRLLRQERASATGGFYSQDEFDLEGLISRHPEQRFLELGRSCVLPAYRSRRTIEVLWQGIWAYVNHYRIDVMTGCASFHGTVPAAHAQALSFLSHNCRAAGPWEVRAQPSRHVSMDLMPAEAINAKLALACMPPLVKGYLRMGARFGEGCVIDRDFGTTDVFVILQVAEINHRYINYYGSEAQRFAA